MGGGDARHPGHGDGGAQVARALHVDDGAGCKERADGGAPVAQLLDELLDETGYREALEAERTIEAQGRLENLEELVRVTRSTTPTTPRAALGEFLQQIALFADADTIRDDEGLVTLMTMHNAKGLEFPIVFMIGMEDGTFPHSRSIEEGNIDEERRLAYVGLTRAMRDLTLTYARRRGAFGGSMGGPTIRSRFLDEIPRELTDQPARHRARLPGARAGRVVVEAAAASAEQRHGRRAGLPRRRRHRPRQARRGRRDGHRAGRDRRRALRRRRLGPQADGRLRADQAALSGQPPTPSDHRTALPESNPRGGASRLVRRRRAAPRVAASMRKLLCSSPRSSSSSTRRSTPRSRRCCPT